MTITRRRFLLIVMSAFVAAFAISVGVLSARKQQRITQKAQHPKDWLTTTPEVSSKVKDLEIVNIRIIRPNTDAPGVAFEIRNNSDKGVMSYEVICGNGGISQDGLEDEDNPIVIIKPYSTYTVEMNDELTPGEPIVITAAVFEDGTEEGDKFALEGLHKVRTHQRARLKAIKEKGLERDPNQ
jgi:hypothetical protein